MDVDSPYLFDDFDLAEAALWAFWLFFLGLVIYLRREDRREGYPLESDTTGRLEPLGGLLFTPAPKTFLLPHGHGTRTVPRHDRDTRPIAARRSAPADGSPIEPTGDPLADGVGPAAWVDRPDHPDLVLDGGPRIMPMRATPEFHLAAQDTDPRGWPVLACDGQSPGVISDVWIDRSELLIRYLEVQVGTVGARKLIPMTMAVVDRSKGVVRVNALTAAQYMGAPSPAADDRVTLREEDRITGYFGGGHLYATPDRQEPWL